MAKLDYEEKVIRDATILTNSYVSATVRWIDDNLNLTEKNQVMLYLDLTLGSLTACVMKIEFSADNIDFYQETSFEVLWWIWNVSLYEYNFVDTGKFRLAFPIKDKVMRVSVKWTWTVTNSSLKIISITWLA